jgi:exopolysaccharide biosynthesis WecB/TagA/CpsF family protein
LGKLDADVELPPEFLDRLLRDFAADPLLGMTAGALTEWSGGTWRRVAQPVNHPPAPARLYTRECFEACGGFRERLGWDTIDEVYARMAGFRAQANRELEVHHLRPLGTADGWLRGRARHGECAWILHYSFLWVALRAVKVALTFKPRGLAGLAFVGGYVAAWRRGVPHVEDRAFRRFVRQELRARLAAPLRRLRPERRGSAPARITVLGVEIDLLQREAALARFEQLHDRGQVGFVVYVNPNVVNQAAADPGYRATLDRAALRIADGFGIRLAAWRHNMRVPAILNGTDFNVDVLRRCAARGLSVYLLGGRPGMAARARDRLTAEVPGLRIVGIRDGYFPRSETREVLADIRASGAVVLMVALGSPLQERWLDRHLADTGARVGLGVGGFFDFSAGAVRRAPAWMNSVGLEWLFRLAMEPQRLARRYVVGNPLFLWRIAGS